MNYFNELLESYDKLKKRKFKLIYLNEQGTVISNASVEDAIAQAENLPTPVKGQIENTAENPKLYSGDIGIYKSQKGKPGLARMSKAPLNGKSSYISVQQIVSPEIKQKILQLMQGDLSGEEEQAPNTQQQQEQLPPQEVPEVTQEVVKPLNNISLMTLQNLYKEVMKFNEENPDSVFKELKGFTGRGESTGDIFTGLTSRSVAGRFSSAEYIVYNEELEGYEKKEISQDIIDSAINSYAAVVKAALRMEDSCEEFKKSIGLVYGKDNTLKKILYKINPDESDNGLVMPLGVTDSAFISQAHKNCQNTKRSQRTTLQFVYGGAKSSVKGALSESMIDFSFIFKRFQSKNLTKKEREDISQFLTLSLKNKLDSIKVLAESLKEYSGFATDLETAFIEEVITEEYVATSSIAEARKYLSKELSYQRKMIDEFFPNSICALNTASEGTAQTGERSDRKFIYSDRKLAIQDFLRTNTNLTEDQISLEEATLGQIIQLIEQKCAGKATCTYRDQLNLMLEAGGLKDKSSKTKLFLISVGLKRYGVLDKIGLGSIDSISRMNEIFTQTNPNDTRLAEGFVDSVFNKLSLDKKSKQEMLDYQQKLQKELDKVQTLISSNYTIANGDKPDFSNPIEVCKRLNDILKTNSRKDDSKFTNIIKLFNEAEKLKKDKDGNIIDKTGIIPKITGKIQKMIILKRIQDSLEKNDPKVRNMLLAQLLLTGSTKDENMYQSMTDDSGSTKVIRHNEIFNVLLQAEKSKNLKIIATDSSVRFSLINNSDIFIDLKIDITNGYEAKLPKTSIDAFNISKSNLDESVYQIQEDLLEEVFILQEKIIKFMNQGK